MSSKITDRILPQAKEWQSRPLPLYLPFCIYGLHPYIRYGKMAASLAGPLMWCWLLSPRGIRRYPSANEVSKFWRWMLNDLKNRRLKDVMFFCVDELTGFKETISAVYPQAQRRVIHMLRNSFKYVNYSDLKNFFPAIPKGAIMSN